ncbi:lachesin isoform X1 [Daphnia magna]|uniref:lachesin isoform X1 n=1 Tax=Daphnia magna TaxID=35525 RepID=UPI001E1BB25D|nr:lachesin isoform X1 [Daphnia magna]XP_032784975.2 lachesin isoform X1 [Daphnia magna]
MSRLFRLCCWCWALSAMSLDRLPLALTATDEAEPDFIGQIDNVTVAQGRDAILSCTVSHLNDYTVGWVKVDTKAIQATGRRVVTLNSRVSVENIPDSPIWKLIIKSAQPDDAGYYMAQINTDPMKSQMAYLSVMEPPNIDDEATPSVRQVRENEPVELYCQATGQPVPIIAWKREDGTNISHDPCRHANDTQQKIVSSNGSLPKGHGRLCIASADRSSMGTYFCIASNGVLPSVSKRIQLVVLFPTAIRAEKPLVGAPAGVNGIGLECIVEASPLSHHLFWYFGNTSIGPNERHTMTIHKINAYTIKMTLAILNLRETDAGLYRCQAGRSEATIRLYIHNPMTTPSRSTTTKWMLDIRTTPWKERQLRTSAAHLAIIQSPVITTETYRSVTLNRHTSSQAEVLTSSNRPVQEVVYKNPSVHRRPPSSSTASDLNHQHRPTGQLVLMTSMIAILTQVISFVSC